MDYFATFSTPCYAAAMVDSKAAVWSGWTESVNLSAMIYGPSGQGKSTGMGFFARELRIFLAFDGCDCVVTNTTIEAIPAHAHDHGGRIVLLLDEGARTFSQLDQYKSKKGDDRQMLMEIMVRAAAARRARSPPYRR